MGLFRKIYQVIPVIELNSSYPKLSIVWEFHYCFERLIGLTTRRPTKEEIAGRKEVCDAKAH